VRVVYRHFRPLTVAYARRTGPYGPASREAWQALAGWIDRQQARRLVKRGLGLFHDNPRVTAPELLRYDACVEMLPGLEADTASGIGRQVLHGGSYAVHTHVGSYTPVGDIFSHLHREWVPKQGLSVDYDRPFIAIYLNDPYVTREVHRRTEVCIPVIPVSMYGEAEDDGTLKLVRAAG
jgi:AraC family transcriptional regulator